MMLIKNELFESPVIDTTPFLPPKVQLLKWVGSKHKFAAQMSQYFPSNFNNYHEPFVGSGSILATIAPNCGYASDIYEPLIQIWLTLKNDPDLLISWYKERRSRLDKEDKKIVYESIKASFNKTQNGADFLYLSRACWGGVIRFRKVDGYMSTPIGWHDPISLANFQLRVYDWHERIKNTIFECIDYKDAFKKAMPGDFIFCDPPYKYSQSILYGSQDFDLKELFNCIKIAKLKGVYVAMSIDGHSKSGKKQVSLDIPEGIFEREIDINYRFSMLLRFKKLGQKLTDERDTEKLYLTY
jgi:DNA adenine methylase